ncbi:similar to Saccharomyces cerevisiae YPR002W PDH1 Mitochondrial protein that participates in respiration, induced by diauxic shift [Maudiozyma saulgeensis]|uniref:Similar to Saccharomyces cerevisiae YPR002W PDH1 Mitochondrial protein that participates in respiration, induced by diauxic shift n=1 Tax=Maudiozyma saulgeensis TaxID=1789683 RepID=A0A1X7R0V2_9SACH|nr:similar to Saccharomyces cerevisiae YPR002W PDH1 Mitochondrial protein that participates in respiration, induced by diauxic shift [Kazachstania saulgeensis]
MSRRLLPGIRYMSTNSIKRTMNDRPTPDELLTKIASYVHNTTIDSKLAFTTAKYCLLDTLGCGLASLKYSQVEKIIKPIVPQLGKIENGCQVPGTNYKMDPINGAFVIGTTIRWLDFNDCWLASEWGHPSDNLGGILAVIDFINRSNMGSTKPFLIKDLLEAMIKAHEIQGIIALDNSFNGVGLDHVILVKLATTAVVSKLIGLNEEQTVTALSHAFVDGHPLRTYRHSPNTNSRKSWAAGDATSRAVKLAYLVKDAQIGCIPSVLTTPRWGLYDTLFNGKPFKFNQRQQFQSYVMENILFKISFPAEFHAQTAVEASIEAHKKLNELGKNFNDIKKIRIRTQDAAMNIIDKNGPLYNYADRDHCIQYMVAVPLIHGRLTADDYTDEIAIKNNDIDNLRSKMYCVRDDQFTKDYYDPQKRSIANALLIELNDGTILDEIVVEYPIGHKFRREEGIPLLMSKFENHIKERFGDSEQAQRILQLSSENNFEDMPVHKYIDEYIMK